MQIGKSEDKIREIKANYQELLEASSQEKKNFLEKIESNHQDYNDLYTKFQKLLAFKQQEALDAAETAPNLQKLEQKESNNKRCGKILKYQVETLGKQLKFNLMIENIAYEEIGKFFYEALGEEAEQASIKEVQEILKIKPFNLTNHNDLLLVSRFLIENNVEDFVILDLDKKQDLIIIISILKKFIGNYQIPSREQEQSMYLSIAQIIEKFGHSLRDNLQMALRSNPDDFQTGCITKEKMKQALQFIDAGLTLQQEDYFYMQLFKYSKDLNIINVNLVFDIFDGNFEKEQTSCKNDI